MASALWTVTPWVQPFRLPKLPTVLTIGSHYLLDLILHEVERSICPILGILIQVDVVCVFPAKLRRSDFSESLVYSLDLIQGLEQLQ